MRAATITCCSIWNNGPRNFQKMELLYLAYHISKYFDHATSKIINRRNNMLRKLAAIGIQPNVRTLFGLSTCNENWHYWAGNIDILGIFDMKFGGSRQRWLKNVFLLWHCCQIWLLSWKVSIFENIVHGTFWTADHQHLFRIFWAKPISKHPSKQFRLSASPQSAWE